MNDMTYLLFFKKNPKDPDHATKISGWLLLAAIVAFVAAMFLHGTPVYWLMLALGFWLFLDSATYIGWRRGYRALESQLMTEITERRPGA